MNHEQIECAEEPLKIEYPRARALLDVGLRHHQAGQLGDAERLYRQVLEADPSHADALHLLGVIAHQVGRADVACELIGKAVAINGAAAAYRSNLANALKDTGRLDEAVAAYNAAIRIEPEFAEAYYNLGNALTEFERHYDAVGAYTAALRIKPDDAKAHYNLGNTLAKLGHLDDAIVAYRAAISCAPDFAEAYRNLGSALAALARFDDAIAAYEIAIRIKPDDAQAHATCANALERLGRLEDAIASYKTAIRLKPDDAEMNVSLGNALNRAGALDAAVGAYNAAIGAKPDFAEAYYNLGVSLNGLGKSDDAVVAYNAAIRIKPDFAEAHSNLGILLKGLGCAEEALAAYKAAIRFKPDYAEARYNLGNALKELGRLEEASTAYSDAIRITPDYAEAYFNKGILLNDQGLIEEAVAAFDAAIRIKPDYAEAHTNLGVVVQSRGQHREAMACYERAIALRPQYWEAHSNLLMSQHYSPHENNQSMLAAAKRFAAALPARLQPLVADGTRDPERRLRVGLVSADLRTHPVGFFLEGLLACCDRTAFEIVCYANDSRADALTKRLRDNAAAWRSIVGIADPDAAAMIGRDRIDILVDLSGHSAKNRLPLFALRPAPVQASWLGYFGTTGLHEIDAILLDEASVPPDEEGAFVERVVRLPGSRFCYAPPDYAPEVKAPPYLENGYVTFGSFNNLAKINEDVLGAWAAILNAAPSARLILKWKTLSSAVERDRLSASFAAVGGDIARLELRGASHHAKMLDEYGDIDVALDPFPFGGGLTSCEALWMGVPVLTMPETRIVSRQTFGFLAAIGLDGDFAVASLDAYTARGAAFAADPSALEGLRKGLRKRMKASPLCDAPSFARKMESAWRDLWRRWCNSGDAIRS